ncbi:hypothetical protein PP613_26125 [Mycobacteroides abscessus]|nr:hypothetical protein [Mycobacteroides abscessus]MDM2412828.1 hypothetical protein [Mycobacteroides abscessus]
MTSGVDRLRNRRKTRPKVEPRHPTGGGAAKTLDDLNNAGPSLPPDAQNPGPEEIAEVAAPESPPAENEVLESEADQALDEQGEQPEGDVSDPESAAADDETGRESETPDEEADRALDSENSAEGDLSSDDGNNDPDEDGNDDTSDDADLNAAVTRELPDLELDWTDPLNHIERNTRLSVPNSVVLRFKAEADRPGSPQYTEIMLQAVYDKLAELPELIVARRPKEQQAAGSFPFRRRSAPTPAASTDPKTALYMRPNNGEVELLGRIVKWANLHIKDGHPGRKDTDRSELITAALDATLPQLAQDAATDGRPVKPAAAS